MKRFFYICFVVLLATACVEPLQPYSGPVVNKPEDETPVTIEFSLPPVTKGDMAHDPDISTIHVAVFNQAGVLKQYEEATLTKPGNVTNGNNTTDGNPKYTVQINMSATKRILHFIGDSPVDTYDKLVALAGTSGEDAVLNALTTGAGKAAYWQRIELDKIDAYTYDGTSYTPPGATQPFLSGNPATYSYQGQTIKVYSGDFITRDGYKVLDGTGYFASTYVSDRLANIPLIRNFVEITVSKDEVNGSNFTPVQYALMNVPKAGYVAPFDAKKGEFASVYTYSYPESGAPVFNETLIHSTIAASGYLGTLAGSIDQSVPDTFIDLTGSDPLDKKAYMYERPVPNTQQPATCILVAGHYDDPYALKDENDLTWFKFEIADQNGGFFPMYRGLSYDIKIGQISGTPGYASAADAARADAIGDISSSPTTATLVEINDGKGTTLIVEYIDYVANEAENKTIYYTMYYKDPSNSSAAIQYLYNTISFTGADAVTHPDQNYKAITGNVTIDNGTFNSGTPDDTKIWKRATVPLAASGQNTLHSILRVEGTSHEGKAMYRDVHYRVMGARKFKNGENELKGTYLLDEEKDRETTLTIYLPSDLGFSMFPLILRIEAENGHFTTADGLPVESGPSLFEENRNTFYFLKTIDYDDYNAKVLAGEVPAFTAKFKTTCACDGTTSTNATNFRVLDKIKKGRSTPYFEYAECFVSVGGPVFQISDDGNTYGISASTSVKADVTSATFYIKSTGDENPTWTLEASDNVNSLSSQSGSGFAEITVYFDANESTETSNSYIVTAKREDFDDLTFTVTQAKVTNQYYTINLNAAGSYGWTGSTVNPDTESYYSYQSNNAGIDASLATMSVTVVGYTDFKIYIRNNAEANYDYVVVRKIDAPALTYNDWTTADSKAYSIVNTEGTSFQNYTEVQFKVSDGLTDDDTPHTFYIQFRKDNSWARGNDCAYVLIPKTYTFVQNP